MRGRDHGDLMELSDLEGFRQVFLQIFGFGIDGVDFAQDVSPLG